MIDIAEIGYDNEALQAKAYRLAKQLNFDVAQHSSCCLFVTETQLALKTPTFSLMSADFSTTLWKKRNLAGKKQGLVRACKPMSGLKIIDATAGWGRDAAVLASFGAEVVMLERNVIMASLLEDALERRSFVEQQQMKLCLYAGDAYTYLAKLEAPDYPDVIYIDPMHPQRTKSALVKKDMQVLHKLIGPDEDALRLMSLAITRVKSRVVVKWPQKVPPLLPTFASVAGKTVRFDIYC